MLRTVTLLAALLPLPALADHEANKPAYEPPAYVLAELDRVGFCIRIQDDTLSDIDTIPCAVAIEDMAPPEPTTIPVLE